MNERDDDLQVSVDGRPAPYLGRTNLVNGAIQAGMPEPIRGLFRELIGNATGVVHIRRITAGSYSDPQLAYFADT